MERVSRLSAVVLLTALLSVSARTIQGASREQPLSLDSQNTTIAASWGDILERLRRRRVPGGGRRSGVVNPHCIRIAPQMLSEDSRPGAPEVWSLRPLFLWRGAKQRLEVREELSDQLVWYQDLAAKQRRAMYQGEPLQPGGVYYWQLLPEKGKAVKVYFEIMASGERRDRLAEGLSKIESRLKASGASAEAIARARAGYFARRKLWADVLRELHSVSEPSAALQATLEAVQATDFCRLAEDESAVSGLFDS